MKIEHKKIFRDPSKILKNISWSISICLEYSWPPQKLSASPLPLPLSYILNVRFLSVKCTSTQTQVKYHDKFAATNKQI